MNRILKFAGVGIATTIFDYVVYSILVMAFFGGDTSKVAIATIISGTAATFVAYFLHSKITWRERNPGKYGIIKFFLWNVLLVIAIRPALTFVFGLLEGLYQFAFMISDGINLPFSYEFVNSTGIYVLMTIVTMILNYLFYGKIVFGKTNEKEGEEVDMKRVGESREKEKSKAKGKNSSKK